MASIRRSSGASLTSRTTYGFEEEPRYDEMTDAELRECLEMSIRTNEILIMENDVFERYLTRHDPQSLVSMAQVLEAAKQVQKVTSQLMPVSSGQNLSGSIGGFSSIRMRMPTSPSTASSVHTFTGSRRFVSSLIPHSKGFRITLAHRIEMANKEIEEMKKHLSIVEKQTTKKKAILRAQMEEIQLRIREIQEAKDELEENVVKKGVDPLTGKIPAEKFVRFMEEWGKAADRMVEKLRLKSLTLRAQIKKATTQLHQREELGESLHPIDFQALAIENQDYLKEIEEKNVHLVELKKITGRYNSELSIYKDRLAEKQSQLKNMKKMIKMKKDQTEKFKNEEYRLQGEIDKIEKQMAGICKLTEKYQVPDAMEFIRVQTELREMKKTYNRLERHRKLQETELENMNKQQDHLDLKKHDSKKDLRLCHEIIEFTGCPAKEAQRKQPITTTSTFKMFR